ncbi:MAG: nitrilase [Acidobacteria bacterium]|nr:nitrilase [Acidobacteriota bacterium]MBU4330082.1 nitrilase [Acidobacteriota bacterium]MBU4495420.1 nitrilase [Acidobacteriota bacterium]MCG2814932.1 nitrilase [Candidatus Aminicenantes bacterium]
MKIGIVQSAPYLGDVRKNLESHLEAVEKASAEKIDLLVFPELSLTGYTLCDLTQEIAMRPDNNPVFKKLLRESGRMDLVFGFVEEKERGLFYNSAAYLRKGQVRHIHRKVYLPTYGMFEEGKFFTEGRNFDVFPADVFQTGMMICYDFLQFGACYLLFAGGAELIICLSAAPGRGYAPENKFGSSDMWELMGAALSRFTTSYVIYCNRVGFEDGKAFAGGSFVYGPTGSQICCARYGEEDYISAEIHPDALRDARCKRLYKRDDRPEIIQAALQRLIQKHED